MIAALISMRMAPWPLIAGLALAVLGSAFVGGCSEIGAWWIGEGTYRYDYRGRLLQLDGKTPLSSASVVVQRSRSDLALQGRDLQRVWDTGAVRADATGEYRGGFTSRYTGPGAHMPDVLEALFVYVEQPDGWHVYRVSLTKEMQPPTENGRKVTLPDIAVGRDPSLAIVPTKAAQ